VRAEDRAVSSRASLALVAISVVSACAHPKQPTITFIGGAVLFSLGRD
jgi:hypothetical protein